ncbi:hypothetical protein DRN86_04205 [Candidatus Geothermarchaeota archaeon]|nr:MAG: hypothetical protein DRN86_04205 [Candidatus Geothermarchaeota archaeon]
MILEEPEVPYVKELYKAIYLMPTTKQTYDYLEKHLGKDPAKIIKTGTSSDNYARSVNPNVFILITEVPYYYDPRMEDLSKSDTIRRKAILNSIEESRKILNFVDKGYREVKGS